MIALLLAAMLQVTPPSIRTLDRGTNSQAELARQEVARTPAEWSALWRSHAPNRPVPDVDWSSMMVAAVFLGSRSTGGYSVEIVRTRADGGSLVVEYVEKRPAPGAITVQILTSPFHIVVIPAFSGPVRFVNADK